MERIKAWAVIGNMKSGKIRLNPVGVENMWLYPVFQKKRDAIKTMKSSPLLFLDVVPVLITPLTTTK
jgi:hypothetical protein